MSTKFDTLYETLKSQVSSLYHIDTDGDVNWLRKEGNLEGAPEVVDYDFYAGHMGLSSLEGGPKTVKDGFYCYGNHLQSLKGSPSVVKGDFDCECNWLETLEGAPEKIGGSFACNGNPLKSLKGIPEAKSYILPKEFTEKDARKEVEQRRFRKSLDTETLDTFGYFIAEL